MDDIILLLLGAIASLIAVMTPIIKLNTNITRLADAIESLDKTATENRKDINELDNKVQDHEIRIDRLEHK